jgi:FkbM family methyltransferase
MIVMRDRRCDPAVGIQIVDNLKRAGFREVTTINVTDDAWDAWPQSPNLMFRRAAQYIAATTPVDEGWLWIEPDAIPMGAGWFDALEAEYEQAKRAGKLFVGDFVEVANVPVHMSGVGIYPVDLTRHAGLAMLADEIAWDVFAAEQIVPKMHNTDLIVHNWRHDPFKNQGELDNLLSQHPQCVLFHADKTGSIPKLLRERKYDDLHKSRGPDSATNQNEAIQKTVATEASGASERDVQPNEQGKPTPQNYKATGGGSPAGRSEKTQDREAGNMRPLQEQSATGEAFGASPGLSGTAESRVAVQQVPRSSTLEIQRNVDLTFDIFIKSYPKDYEWLSYCLRSIKKFGKGFRRVVVVAPDASYQKPNGLDVWSVQVPEQCEDGYLSQQMFKLNAHQFSDADYILHVDSDTVFNKPFTPDDFIRDGKPVWMMTPYSKLEVPWRMITEKFLDESIEFEFMRRLPILIPRWAYWHLAKFCAAQHGSSVNDYICKQPSRAFSEFNAMGAYLYLHHRDKIFWVNTDIAPEQWPELKVEQFWSHSGVTPEIKAKLEQLLLNGNGTRILDTGIMIINDDCFISRWVKETGRLDHDQNLLPDVLPHIPEGGTVIDAGAFIGDHTIAYVNKVGPEGAVIAFEPNPIAYRCLKHNLRMHPNVVCLPFAMGEENGILNLKTNGNAGASFLTREAGPRVDIEPLDTSFDGPRLDFIKLDVEGYELHALEGAEETIKKYRPKMLIEINREALARQGVNPEDVFAWLKDHGYESKIIQSNRSYGDPIYDILCEPMSAAEPRLANRTGKSGMALDMAVGKPMLEPEPFKPVPVSIKPWKSQVETIEEIKRLAAELKRFCVSAPRTRQVRQALRNTGVIK